MPDFELTLFGQLAKKRFHPGDLLWRQAAGSGKGQIAHTLGLCFPQQAGESAVNRPQKFLFIDLGSQRIDLAIQSFGGLLGILLAVGATYALAALMGMPPVLDAGIMLLAFLFSAAVGVIFGYFPARKAARQDPIEALRYE